MQRENSASAMGNPGLQIFTALNGLRFLAALAVVFYHYARKMEGFDRFPRVIRSVIECGPAAVGFFFILSGFVLAHRYLQDGTEEQATPAFYRARFARLYPAYMVAFVLFLPGAIDKYLVHQPAGSGAGLPVFVLSATLYVLMLQAWTPLAQAWNGPSWSLSVEAFMYLVFPFIGWRLKELSNRKTLLLLCGAWLVPAAVASAYAGGLVSRYTWQTYLTNNPLLWTPLFVMGICATRFLPAWNRVSQVKAGVISTAALVALVGLAMVCPPRWTEIFATGGVAPLLFCVVVFFSRTSGALAKIIGAEIFNTLGKASYVLYIIQAPMWHYWQLFAGLLTRSRSPPVLFPAWEFWLFVPVLVLVSLTVERFVETPIRHWLSGIRRKPQAAVTPINPAVFVGKEDVRERA
jgi:peptidoglycan/LPS O-acetylase OafA/YrhL